MNTTRIWTVVAAMVFALAFTTGANGAISWTQHMTRDDNPGDRTIRPNLSCDGQYVFFTHQCRNDVCDGVSQDGGSVYQVNVETEAPMRIIESALGSSRGVGYVSANDDGSILAIASSIDHLGTLTPDQQNSQQIYVYEQSNGTFERLTAYESNEKLLPNISCDGNVVCWSTKVDPDHPENGEATPGRAFCYNRTTGVRTAITGTTAKTRWISPNNDGTKFVVASNEELAGTLPSAYTGAEEIYFWDGSVWSRLTLTEQGPSIGLEPRLTKDESRVVFAMEGAIVEGDPENRRIAFQYSFAAGLITRIFQTSGFTPPETIADFVSVNSDGSVIATSSFIDLDGDGTELASVGVFTGSYTSSDVTFQSGSPVDLALTDPLGRSCLKALCSIPGCGYFEFDFNGDSKPNDRIWCDPRVEGVYSIVVTPDGTEQPGDTYSLISATNDTLTVVEPGKLVGEIPPDPYVADVPPPVYPLLLATGRIQPRNGLLRIRATYREPVVSGDVLLSITSGIDLLTQGLGNTSSYQKLPYGIRTRIQMGDGSTIRVQFKERRRKGVFVNWQATIEGRALDLSDFSGATDQTITQDIKSGNEILRSVENFDRRPNGDLSFRRR